MICTDQASARPGRHAAPASRAATGKPIARSSISAPRMNSSAETTMAIRPAAIASGATVSRAATSPGNSGPQ